MKKTRTTRTSTRRRGPLPPPDAAAPVLTLSSPDVSPQGAALPAPAENGVRLATFPRVDGQQLRELRVNYASFNGHPYVNLRMWYQLPDGRYVPHGLAGVTVRLRELEVFHAAITHALELATVDVSG
jgi:hypothetical protein